MIRGEKNMTNNKYERGIIFSVLMLSSVLVGLTMMTAVAFAAQTIEVTASNPTPQVNQTISINAIVKDNGSISSLNGNMEFFANSDPNPFASVTITGGMASTSYTTATAGTVTIIAKFNSTLQGSTTVVFIAPALILSANPTTVRTNSPINVNFIVTSAGTAVSGVTVTLGGVAAGSGTTDPNGISTISVNATSPGTITATAAKTGYTSASASILASQPSMSISANPTTIIVNTPTNVNFTLISAGAPVSGATITLSGVAAGSVTTDPSGIATLSVNATSIGTINATATRTGFASVSTNIIAGQAILSISANPTTIVVNTSTIVNLTVTSAGAAVGGATITLNGVLSGSATTDPSGKANISMNATSSGTITATATKTGYTSASASILAGQPQLNISAIPTNVTVNIPTNVNFTVTSAGAAVSGATVTLGGAGVSTTGTTDANGSVTISVNATFQGKITATATKTGYPGGSIDLLAQIAADTTPPESIKDLKMESNGTSWIKWNWTNPISDFSYVAIWINNGWHNASVGANFFNTSGILSLLPGTEYTIATHTVDTAGNVNSTWISLNSSTSPNTPFSTGSITIVLSQNSSVTFPSVSVPGNTLETPDTSGQKLPSAFVPVGSYLNISTTATYASPVTVRVTYNPALVAAAGFSDSDVRLYHYNVSAGQWDNITNAILPGTHEVQGTVSSLSPFVPAIPAKPSITKKYPTGTSLETIGNTPITFNITVDQTANVTWYIDSKQLNNSGIIPAGTIITFTNTPPSSGNYNVSVSASNFNGTDTEYWNWTVRPITFFTGNRIWDGSKPNDFSLTYSWTPMSFSGFYYNAKDDVGNENITITLASNETRTISKNNLVYTTSPQEVSFTYSNFGKYQVIGFMAEKYFAGYNINTTPQNPKPSTNFNGISAVGQGQLHKVLMDDDTKRTIAVGGTIALQDGYVLKARDIDLNARTMLLSLLKDGNEVDVSPLSADQTYVYTKRVGNVENLPLIMVRFDNVFAGNELQVAFMKGLFQISENPTIIKTGNTFRNMQVTQVNNNLIEMRNSNDIGLSKGTTADVMGDVKILVANNVDSALRFALSVERTGDFEVRSTVYSDAAPISVWTPYNFGMNIGKTSIGFYYDLDSGVGGESLNLTNPVSGRTIPDQSLVYSTAPQEVNFIYTGFGKYQVIGFMADKYFAGYTSNTKPTITRPTTTFDGKSALANGALHKVLIDDDTKQTISVGGTIALKEGYVLKATDIDLNARTMLLSLLKDGSEVDLSPLSAGETYVYSKTVGGTEALPLIMVRFENVFSGQELQVAFLKGIFQISDTPTKVKTTDQFGKMEVRTVSRDIITMSNDGSIGLDKNKNDVLMGNIKLKVADNDNLRFYFAVDVTALTIASQLVIDAPTKAMAGDTIKIKVTAGGVGMDSATVNIANDSRTTDTNGSLNYTLPRNLKGTYSISASKTGYDQATQNIDIDKFVDYTLSLDAPSQANQFDTITIKVLYNGTAMSGASVTFDNTTVGTTDSNGEITYKLETSGTHSISASKQSYITVMRDIEIRAPYSEFKGLDINIIPNTGSVGDAYLVRSNITNVGTKGDLVQVDLIVNGTAVDNKTVTLGAGEKLEVNFTRRETVAGNATIEIMGQSMIYEAKEKPTNWLLIVVIATAIGIVIVYIITSKGLINLGSLKQKFSKK